MTKTPTKMERVPIDELIPYINNARIHSDEQIVQLQASIREFGFVQPILIDGRHNIIAGHGRVEAARREGMTEIPCVFVEHLTEAQRKAYIIADNRLAEMASWDHKLLEIELKAWPI
jgi:ParB-like chromosome segregation protein Spo0J